MTRHPMKFIDSSAAPFETLEQWRLSPRDGAFVSVPNDFDVESLEAELPRLAGIALHFPKWVDGRAYSQARLLRSRFRFAGEVRATGEVLVDMVPLLRRTGFDTAQMRAGQSVEAAQRALQFFPGHYQGDVTETRPLFARGAA
jgi:uncharacterized protein (DUF934 family)